MVGLVGGILGAFELEKVGGLSTCFLLYALISRIWGAMKVCLSLGAFISLGIGTDLSESVGSYFN